MFEKTRQDQDKVLVCGQDAGRFLGSSRCNSDSLYEHQIDVNRPVLVAVRVGSERALGRRSKVLMELLV